MTFFASLLIAAVIAIQTPPVQTPPVKSPKAQSPVPQIPAPGQVPSALGQAPPAYYTLGPNDELKITVFDEPDLTNNYRVEADGTVSFPLIKTIPARGLTVAEFSERLRAKLSDGFLKSPVVRVEVIQYKSQSVIVSGEVRMPNEYYMTGSMTLIKALAMAGSPLPSASGELTIAHQLKAGSAPDLDTEPKRVNWKDIQMGKSPDLALQDGDLINVPRAQMFYVNGQVKNSGALVWDPGITVEQAIVLAGGLTDRGSTRGLKVTRVVGGKSMDVKVKLTDRLQPEDVLYVGSKIF
jgi:polysaccharide export outer membrane protein